MWPNYGLDGARYGLDRIVAAAKSLGVSRIDILIITHYHADHIGGAIDLLQRMPVGTVIDHGPNRDRPFPDQAPNSVGNRMAQDSILAYAKYLEAIKGHRHIVARPGAIFHFGTLTDTIVASDGKVIAHPLPGAGGSGARCDAPPMAENGGLENEKSVGSILRFGKVSIAALGDLTWNREHDLFCPIDKVGHVNILIVTNHGMAVSSNPASIAAMRPDIAIIGNSATKGDVPATFNVINSSPGTEGVLEAACLPRRPGADRRSRLHRQPGAFAGPGPRHKPGHCARWPRHRHQRPQRFQQDLHCPMTPGRILRRANSMPTIRKLSFGAALFAAACGGALAQPAPNAAPPRPPFILSSSAIPDGRDHS